MTRPQLFTTPLSLLLLITAMGCSFEIRRTTTYTSPIYASTNFPPCEARGWSLATPVAGLFIGVSAYKDYARVYSTPAHMIGALAFHNSFRVAANAAPKNQAEEVSLTVLVDLYRPKNTPKWIDPTRAFAGGWSASNEFVTLSRVKDALEAILEKAELLYTEHGRTLLVMYIAAHGWIYSDGESYIIPADGRADAPSSWISYRSLIEAAAQFVGDDLNQQRRALIVLDACQFDRHDQIAHVPVTAPPGVMVVRAAAPGQYAWQWSSTSTVRQEIYGTTGYRISFPIKPKGPERGLIEQETHSKISVLPIAAECSLKDAAGNHQELMLSQWADGIIDRANSFLEKIPDIEKLGLRQDIQIDFGKGTRDFLVFRRDELQK